MTTPWLVLLFGCGGSAPGVAVVLNGITDAAVTPVKMPLPADGAWDLSPDRIDVTFREIAFEDDDRYQRWVQLDDCTASYDLTTPSLSALLDCPFEVPRGRYTNLRLKFEPDLAVTVDDPMNGLWTDGVGLVTSAPSGGAVATVITGQDTVRTTFSEELIVDEDPVELSIVINAVHSVRATIAGDTVSLQGPVIQLHASPFGVGAAQFLGAPNSLGNRQVGSSHNTELLLFFEDTSTPVYAWLMPGESLSPCARGGNGGGFYQAYATAPGPYDENGGRIGGYLAEDASGAICFALPADQTWDEYSAIYQLDHVDTLGATTPLACESNVAPPAPTSGKTWASGCPAINPQATEDLSLVAG